MPFEDVVPSAPPGGARQVGNLTIAMPPGKPPAVLPVDRPSCVSQLAWSQEADHGRSPSKLSSSDRVSEGRSSALVQDHRNSSRLSVDVPGKLQHHHRKLQLRHILKDSKWYHSPTALRIRNVLHGRNWGVCFMLLLLVALFLPDMWVVTGADTNLVPDFTLTAVMVLFLIELVGLSSVEVTYFMSFFFFMDIIGTVTMVFDITFMFGADNSKAQVYDGSGDGKKNLMLLRATRAARVGARAGRLSRVLRVLRFLPFLKQGTPQAERAGIAGAISGQLANLLATRVALLTILLVIVFPLFDLLTFPSSDYSLRTWAEHLSRVHNDDTRDAAGREAVMLSTLTQMRKFFSERTYGPFRACAGYMSAEGWKCTHVYEGWDPIESSPSRTASSWFVTTTDFMVAYNMHTPEQTESIFAMVTIVFIIGIMIFSGLVLSSVVTELAVRPLERMLDTVKEIASTVFKFAEGQADEDAADEETYDIDSSSEMKLLEKVVQKLAIIANLQTVKEEVITEDMQEEDIGILNMMQGRNIVEDKIKQERRSFMPTVNMGRRKGGFSPMVKYEDFGMTQEVYSSWSYNTLDLTNKQRANLGVFSISRFHENAEGFVNSEMEMSTLNRFITTVEKEYLPNPFHNFSHAVDVLHTVTRLMRTINSESFLVELEQFALLVAAVSHDLGHPGVNNGFLSEVGHELALQYNDRSPLENMHCAKLYTIVVQPECNVFANLTREQYKEVRKFCIETILHTDMMGHNGMVKELQMVFQMNSEMFAASEGANSIAVIEVLNQPETKALAMNNLLHSADVSNPCRTWDCCHPWAMMVLEEFFAQGDQEKMLGVPVQFLNDREKLNRPNSQIGFLEFMIVPYFAAQIKIWPKLEELGTNLQVNIQHWLELWVEDTCPSEEETKKVQARVTKAIETLEEAKHINTPS